jgi:gliding motility-associated-like protein
MKKITLLLITILFSFSGFSQALIQGFETPTTPFGLPLNWAHFESGSASELWYTDSVINGIAPHSGSKQAVLYGENLGVGNSAKYYIASPVVTIPLNGQLRFWVRTSQQGDQGGVFKVKIASAALASNQTSEAAYTTTLQTYTESQISTNVAPAPIVYEEQVINFPVATFPIGTQVYIAFVSEVAQTSPFQGDNFYLDDVLVVSKCLDPITLAADTFTASSAVLSWTNPNPLIGAGLNTCNQWEIEIIPTTELTPSGSGIMVNTNPYTATTLTAAPFAPLQPLTQYKYYVRSICAFSGSLWSGPFSFTTAPGLPVCGGNFVDPGGLGNYLNFTNSTTTICPLTSGDLVTVTFSSFVTEAVFDVLSVYNGTVSPANLLGSYSGNLSATLPGPFTSSAANGCLTFVFTSDDSSVAAGWLANVTCAPIPTCTRPTTLTTSSVATNSVSLAWAQSPNPNGIRPTAWQYLALPCGTAAPTATTLGWLSAPGNPFIATGLISGTCYDFYVRASCSSTDTSAWSLPRSVSTLPGCGGFFVDPGGSTGNYTSSLNSIVTICPSIAGQLVTVTFTSFATEAGLDLLKVYDGDTTAGALLGTFSGTAIPGPITASTATGCLTFVFTSDTSLNLAGWVSSVTCAPPPSCTKPKTLTVTSITQSTALLGWTQLANPDGSIASAWQVLVLPCGSPAPTATSTGWLNTSNPFYITGLNSATCYEYYVRAVCSPTDSSFIGGPKSFNTLIVNDECTGAIEIPVNQNTNCLQTAFGSLAFATGSINANSCGGTIDDDDVWFKFTATSTSHYITILGPNYTGAPFNINYVLYTGTCGVLTQFGGCIINNGNTASGLTVGQTYYVRVYSRGTTASTTTFELCVGTNVGTCATALPLCAIQPIIIPNNVGVPTLPNPVSPYSTTSATVGCLGSAPSPTFYYLQIPSNGNYNFFIEQNTNTNFNAATGIDVDFVAWGPFATNAEACAGITTENAPPTGPSLGCSFSAMATEEFGINNAIAGEVYVIMITNYNGRKGFVRITQTGGPVPLFCCPFGNFTYPKTFYCQNEANPSPTLISNAVAGVYSSTAGLSINSTTGLINLALSTPGTYVIHNTVAPSGTCPADDDSWTITITVPPTSVGIAYSSPTYCKFNSTLQNITQTGNIGGTYTVSPATGLSINTAAGAFTPSTSVVGTYIVSYNLPQVGGCPGAISTTQVEIVIPVPTFNPAPPICLGGTSAPLPTMSLNGITGSWLPAINNSVTTVYTFTPDAGQCATNTTMTIGVGTVAPVFTQVAPICFGETLAALPTTSSNGITGIWSPAINNTVTTDYTFTPAATFCSSIVTMRVVVSPPSLTPVFSAITPICNGASLAALPTTSINGVLGSWSPALNNLATTTYTFTPNPLQCAVSTTLTIIVNPILGVTVNSPTVCSSSTATVTATPSLSGTYTYTWTVPTGATNPGNFPSFTATVSGAYSVVITQVNSLGCSSLPATGNVLISTIRTPTFTQIPNLCQNSAAPTLPTISTNTIPITGTWNSAVSTASVGSTTYTFTPAINQCATTATMQVVVAPLPVATFSYNSASYCKSGANPVLAFTGGGVAGVFSSTAGLSITTAGAIDLAASTPGNYVVTNTIATTGGCGVVTATFAITITAPPVATFSYTASPYCSNAANPSPTFSGGGVAGVFTSTAGLSINASTGVINLAASTTGTYTVTNTIASAGGCATVVATAQVTVALLQVATFSYNSASYCKSGANPILTFTGGGVTGVFSSTTGLAITTAGAIDLAASTPGNYVVTNTIAASGGCGVVTATFTITIAAAPIATFSYTASPYCKNGTNPTPTFSGGGFAGVFTSTVGLSINASTGVINLAASTVGTYTVTNTIASVGSCATVVATAQVTISAAPQATISYSDAFYCYNVLGYQAVTLTGTTGGTYSASPSGLILSSTSGSIVPSTSQSGVYTVTYTILASGGCPQFTTTTTVTIIPEILVELRAVCDGPDFIITALPVAGSFNPANAIYEWTGPNGYTFGPSSNPSIAVVVPGTYISTVTFNGCTHVNSRLVNSTTCTIQKGISPNGDGDNENFILGDVKALSIFNRYGSKVYTHGPDYTNQWHGQSDGGSELPDGTYYYVIIRNSGESITGWIYINR